ncbi:MAG: alpha-glucan family phosphorylase [Dehalococcoidia bacterium]|nr:alpha-glucan family phosphorylase [Dehalococcoidia bacterium]MDD5495305.1 alpha-glucan family phosphorylase [Dehalococcoidia bacterium]
METSRKLKVPERINGLAELAYNLWWSWHLEPRNLFKRLDRYLWKSTGHNPVKMLKDIPYHRLVACADDANYMAMYNHAMASFKKSMTSPDTWFEREYPQYKDTLIAYFSLEFAIQSSLPLYAGGLGVLAGDYCKEASDLGLPLVGVGFMYPQGYFHQHISQDGWQNEEYDELDFADVALSKVYTADGKRLTVAVPLDSVSVYVSAWELKVGRVKLYLLDTNLDENPPAYRGLSARLYGGDREMRLLQELIIGIGGVRVLRALGLNPVVWHANEGHTSFMMLERVRELVQQGVDFKQAISAVQSTSIFTTHTPVPAGNDTFSLDLVDKYFHNYWGMMGIDRDEFIKLGTMETERNSYNMTVLGLKMADHRNGVSKLHGEVCRKMWHPLWPDKEEDDVPIDSITNGVHVPTWVSPQFKVLFFAKFGEEWLEKHDDHALWDKIDTIPDAEIWALHRWLKIKVISSILDRARQRWSADHVLPIQPLAMGALLDTEALTLGFCRRFTEYKRPTLIFKDIERLKHILNRDLQPVQIIFAGKAHPSDEYGKRLIQEVYNIAKDPNFCGRIAFVEDYDMHLARDLVAGVDVWLNTPRALMEASGTSGQKASLNGVVQLSVLDGWWFEGYNGTNGWAVQENTDNCDVAERDRRTAGEIYNIIENKIVPLYYERDLNGIPTGWIKMMKAAMRSNTPVFSSRRMAKEYTQRFYLKAYQNVKASV